MTQARLRNFVHGKRTDPCEAAYSEIVDPSTGKGLRARPGVERGRPRAKISKNKNTKI